MDEYRPPVVDYRRIRRITTISEPKETINAATGICITLMVIGAIVLFKRYQDKLHQSPKSANTLWL